jgi:pilus assembly protein CpaB
MKRPQLIGIAVAAGAGIMAMVGAQTFLDRPQQREVIKRETVDATKVLVARRAINLGDIASNQHFDWVDWPTAAVTPALITMDKNPQAKREFAGSVARSPMIEGEPITTAKLIRAGSGGVLAAILPAGKRAVATRISQESAVANMILPNDHVDVIMTQRKTARNGNTEYVSDTLFKNIRVLAIGQTIEAKDGKRDVPGEVATLELTPRQAEMLAMANKMGKDSISLVLRSIADITTMDETNSNALNPKNDTSSSVNITRYGTTTRQYGVN